MGDEPGAIYFEYQYVVHYPDFSALDELYLSLVAHNIHLQADTFAFIYVPGLGEELDVERMAFNLGGTLRMHIARNELMAARVNPLPLFGVLAKVGVGLLWATIHRAEILR